MCFCLLMCSVVIQFRTSLFSLVSLCSTLFECSPLPPRSHVWCSVAFRFCCVFRVGCRCIRCICCFFKFALFSIAVRTLPFLGWIYVSLFVVVCHCISLLLVVCQCWQSLVFVVCVVLCCSFTSSLVAVTFLLVCWLRFSQIKIFRGIGLVWACLLFSLFRNFLLAVVVL